MGDMTRKKCTPTVAVIVGLFVSAALAPNASAGVAAQTSALTDAYNASAQTIFRQLSEQSQPDNIVLSPYAIGSAMSMTLTTM